MRRTLALFVLASCGDAPALETRASLVDAGATADAGPIAHDAPGSACSGWITPDAGDFGHRIALTFDDGPVPDRTPRVLEVLRRHQIPATFFIQGNRVLDPAARALYDEIVADPLFRVGNHAWSHPHMLDLDADARRAELAWDAGAALGATPPAGFFRFPFGQSDCAANRFVWDAGYEIVGWNIDSHDYSYELRPDGTWWSDHGGVPASRRADPVGHFFDQLPAAVGSTDGGIVLMHDSRLVTVEHLEEIVLRLEAEGWTFVRVDDAAAFPRLNDGVLGGA